MDNDWLRRALIAGAVLLLAIVVARLADRAITRRLRLEPESLTRYRILRRTLVVAIVAVGLLSALLVIPEVRAVAGGILASSAVVGLVFGIAARTTLGNFIAGLFLAFTQQLRLGDDVEIGGHSGTVHEIALTYTILTLATGERLYIPNEKLASDTITNSTIARSGHRVTVDVQIPLDADLDRVLSALQEEAESVEETAEGKDVHAVVKDLDAERAIVTVAAWARPGRVGDVESALRRAAHRRLRAEGVF